MTCARCKGPTMDVTEGARFWLCGPPIARAEYCPACNEITATAEGKVDSVEMTVDVDRKLPTAEAP